MEYEDTVTIATPEGVELAYTLAGLGSRFAAELVDVLLRAVVLGALVAVLAIVGGGPWRGIVLISRCLPPTSPMTSRSRCGAPGRTPGKRWSGLRVVRSGGRPVDLRASSVRTLLRVIDQWASLGVIGGVAIVATRDNQRLGDLAAGTIVIRERRRRGSASAVAAPPAPVPEARLDVTGLGAGELAAIRDFLARREELGEDSRRRVAAALAESLAPQVGGLAPGAPDPERLLEMIARARAAPEESG